MSSTDAGYIDACEAAMEAVRIRKYIFCLGIVQEPMDTYCDNYGAIIIANKT